MNEQLIQQVVSIAKENRGDTYLSYLWGCAQVLLTDEQLKTILDVLEN
jgi:hypothetical protein